MFSWICGLDVLKVKINVYNKLIETSEKNDDFYNLIILLDELYNIIENDGSVQNFDEIPSVLKERYKTVWELKQRHIIDMAKDRGKYICQSQSMNLFLESPDISTMTSMHFYSWKQGLKTGIYYLRSRPSSKAIQFTLKPEECESCSA